MLLGRFSPERLNALRDARSTEVDLHEAKPSERRAEQQSPLGHALLIAGNIILDHVGHTAVSVERNNHTKRDVNGEREDGGREDHGNGSQGEESGRRKMEKLLSRGVTKLLRAIAIEELLHIEIGRIGGRIG